MADPLDPLVEALRQARENIGTPDTRLATITGQNSSDTAQVRFDGETSASSRAYKHVSSYWPMVGERVVMQRVGSTWVIVGRLDDGTTAVQAVGDYAGTLSGAGGFNSSRIWRDGRTVTLYVDTRQSAVQAANAPSLLIPMNWTPNNSLYFTLVDRDTGGLVPAYVTATSPGFLQYVFQRPAGSGILGSYTWVSIR